MGAASDERTQASSNRSSTTGGFVPVVLGLLLGMLTGILLQQLVRPQSAHLQVGSDWVVETLLPTAAPFNSPSIADLFSGIKPDYTGNGGKQQEHVSPGSGIHTSTSSQYAPHSLQTKVSTLEEENRSLKAELDRVQRQHVPPILEGKQQTQQQPPTTAVPTQRRGMDVQEHLLNPPNTNIVKQMKSSNPNRKQCHTGPLKYKARWSCRNQTSRCVVLYHSFVLRPELLKMMLETDHADEVFWMTVHGALNLRKHYPELPVVLATNYPPGFLEKMMTKIFSQEIKVEFGESRPVISRKLLEDHLSPEEIAKGNWRSIFREILYPPAKQLDEPQFPYAFLLKPDAMAFPGLEKYDRVLFLDGDAVVERREIPLVIPQRFEGGERDFQFNHGRCFRNFRGLKMNPKREQEVRAKLKRQMIANNTWVKGYTPSILGGLNPIHTTNRATGNKVIGAGAKTKAANIAGFGKNSRRDLDGAHQYADIFDAFDQLNWYDLALVPEYASFHDMSNAMYFHFFGFANDCESPYESIRQGKKGIYGCRYAWRNRYETQYNTGLIAFRNTRCVKKNYMKRWRLQHRHSGCLRDNTAWDQCSMPIANRRTNLRVGVLPESFNFRQALGKGCSPFLYPTPRGHNFPHFPLWHKPAILIDHDNPRVRVLGKMMYKYNLATDHFVCPPYKPDSPISNSTFLTSSNCSNAKNSTMKIMLGGSEFGLPQFGGAIKCKRPKGSHWSPGYMPCPWKYGNSSLCLGGATYDEVLFPMAHTKPWECAP